MTLTLTPLFSRFTLRDILDTCFVLEPACLWGCWFSSLWNIKVTPSFLLLFQKQTETKLTQWSYAVKLCFMPQDTDVHASVAKDKVHYLKQQFIQLKLFWRNKKKKSVMIWSGCFCFFLLVLTFLTIVVTLLTTDVKVKVQNIIHYRLGWQLHWCSVGPYRRSNSLVRRKFNIGAKAVGSLSMKIWKDV